MQPDELDAAFRRFADTRDPAALARVFDLAAPKLLLVAEHLAPRGTDAEDLVQTVFLQVIRDAGNFDARRAVMPWLLAILHHRALDAARRRARRAGELGAALDDLASGRSPAELSAEAEVFDTLAAALEELPTEQREVLVLRLLHGLRPVEIAHSKGCSPETIRTRLRRGLETLRRLLPRGLHLGAWLALAHRDARSAAAGLAQVRAAVLEHARLAVATQAVAAGTRVASASALLLGALASCLGIGWWLSRSDELAPRAEIELSASARPRDGAARGPERGAAGLRDVVRRASAEATAASTRGSLPTTFRGCVLDADAGGPCSEVRVELAGLEPTPSRGASPSGWVDLSATTTADGRFELRFAPPPELGFSLKLSAEGRTPLELHLDSLRPGLDIDLGEIRMRRRVGLVVAAVDPTGQPVADREIWLREDEPRRVGASSGFVEVWNAHGILRTDAHGRAAWPDLPPGRYRYELDTNFDGPRKATIDVPLQAVPLHHRVVLEAPPPERSISGVVLDPRGEPVAGLELRLHLGGGYRAERTTANGGFLFNAFGPPDPQHALRFELPEACLEYQWIERASELRWGRHDLRLRVRRTSSATLALHVVDAARGTDLTSYGLRVQPDFYRLRNGHGLSLRSAPLELRAEGRALLRELAPGPYLVSVFPTAPFGERGEIPIELGEGEQRELRVEVERAAELVVRVRDVISGSPASEVELTLARVLPERNLDRVTLQAPRYELGALRRGEGGSSKTMLIELDHARSDAHGVAHLRAPARTPALVLVAEGRACKAKLVQGVVLPREGAELELEIERAAIVRGVLGPAELVRRFGPCAEELEFDTWEHEDPLRFADEYPRVELRVAGERGDLGGTHVSADGSFEILAVPAGSYELWVSVMLRTSPGSRSEVDLGPLQTLLVEPEPAGDAEVVLDLSRWLPGRIRCSFTVNGTPWSGRAGLLHLGDEERYGFSELEVRRDEPAESLWLLPGRYAPYVELPFGLTTRRLFGSEVFTLGPGETIDVSASLQRRRIELRAVDGGGALRPHTRLRVSDPRRRAIESWLFRGATDEQGTLILDPAPPGALEVLWERGASDFAVVGAVDAETNRATVRIEG